MPGLDDRLKGALERLTAPADPSGAYERIVEKKIRRRIVRRAEIAGLVIVVLAGTIGGTFALARVFSSTTRNVPIGPVGQTANNGRIAFLSTRPQHSGAPEAIYSIDPDGTDVARITKYRMYAVSMAWSPDGSQIAFDRGISEGQSQIDVIAPDHPEVRTLTELHNPQYLAWSPDGQQIVYSGGDLHLYVIDMHGTEQVRLTSTNVNCGYLMAAWAPSGTKIVTLRSCASGPDVLMVLNSDGTGAKQLGQVTGGGSVRPSWSPDGRRILYSTGGQIFTADADGTKAIQLTTRGHNLEPAWSPDGKRITFTSDRDGNQEIYVMNADGTGQTNLTRNPADDFAPSWQPLPAGVTSSPSVSPLPTLVPTPSPTPAWPLPRCATSWVNGDFDGDGLLDTAAVCRLKGGTFSLNVQWASGAAGAVSLPDCQIVCEARGAGDLNGDGKDEFFLVYSAGASTEFVEVFELPTSEIFGHHPAKIAPPGSPPGFPPGALAQFDLGGSVTHQGYLTCTAPKGGIRQVISTGTLLSSDQTTWKVHETRFSFSPGKDGLGQFVVVSVRDYTAPFDTDKPFVPAGDPCLDF